jgi:hypothetical protein
MAAVAPLRRLESLEVAFAGEVFCNPSPPSVAHVLAALLPALPPTTLRHLSLRANVKTPSTLSCPLRHLQPGAAAALHSLLLQGFHLGDTDDADADAALEDGAAADDNDDDDDDDDDDAGALAQLRALRSLTLDNCTGSSAVREACGAVARCGSLRALRLANVRLVGAASLAALPRAVNARLTCLTLEHCGAGAPAALAAAARAGALAALTTLTLFSPASEPTTLDSAHGGQQLHLAPAPHDMALAGAFVPDAPLQALRSLSLYGADMCAASEWPRLAAPALRSITLLVGASSRSSVRGGLTRSQAEWESVRVSVAAAVAARCPLAQVQLTHEVGRPWDGAFRDDGGEEAA